MSELQLLRREAVLAKVGLSKTTLYALIARGEFPRPIQVTTGNTVAWVRSEVDEFIEARIAATRAADGEVESAARHDRASRAARARPSRHARMEATPSASGSRSRKRATRNAS